MARLRPLLAGLALLLAAPVAATAAVPVRSGEHDGFTRLVFADGTGAGWSVARPAADRVEVAFDGGAPDLDFGNVFARIPRARLTDVRVDGGLLRLDLACACVVEVSRISSGHVVIDILDATVDWQPPAEVPYAARRAGPVLPLGLPAVDLALPVLDRLAAREPGPRRPAGERRRPAPKPRPRRRRSAS